jgi:hypothetical protein
MYKHFFCLLFVFIFITFSGNAKAPKDITKTVTIGVYVTAIYDINIEENYYGVEFLMWFVFRKEYLKKYNLDPLRSVNLIDVYNGEIMETTIRIDSSLKNDIYILKKVTAKVRNDFNVTDFPFDKQVLKLRFEDSENGIKRLSFNVNKTSFSKSGMDNHIKINGIIVKSIFSITHEPYEYKNNFGNPRNLNINDVYDRAVVTINIEREVGFLFLKLFTGLYVSFFIAMLSFFVNPKDINTRFSLPVGSLFAAVGNKYFVDGLLPRVNSMTLADSIHSITFLFIFFIILFSVINIYIFRNEQVNEKTQKIRNLDIKAFMLISVLFIVINVILILNALF